MHQRRKLTNIVPYFHICLNLTNVYIDIKDKILANKTDKCYCKQFIFCFEVVQTTLLWRFKLCKQFFFKFLTPLPPPPLQKNNGSSLSLIFFVHCERTNTQFFVEKKIKSSYFYCKTLEIIATQTCAVVIPTCRPRIS